MKQTNKILIILVSVLIVLLIIAVIMFSAVLKSTNKNVNENQIAFVENNKTDVIDIKQIEDKNEILVAYLDGQKSEIDSNVIVIGTDNQTNNSVQNNSSPYYIKVNVQASTVTIYKKDGNGTYNIPLKSMICSCGAATPVEGTYSLKKYNNWQWKTLFGKEYARYATQISGDILFHSVPYEVKGDNTTLKYEEYDKLGSISTVGCVELTVIDAKWIYENCPAGTQVTFYTDENPGPLGKPTSKLITEDEQVRGWDPTDPDENNPWKTYVRPEKKPEEEKKDEEENQNNITLDNTINNEWQNQTNTTPDSTVNNEGQNQTNTTPDNTVNNEGQNQNQTENNTVNNNVVDNNNTVENNTVDNTTNNNIDNNTNQTTTNTKFENKVLVDNDDITIKSEVMDMNTLQ